MRLPLATREQINAVLLRNPHGKMWTCLQSRMRNDPWAAEQGRPDPQPVLRIDAVMKPRGNPGPNCCVLETLAVFPG